jgi:dTDP-4-amino-4,6-dideoxygalactose transaminase
MFSSGYSFYFWKGRVALYAILKVLGVGPGDEIILPGFTCVVVPNAVHYLGAQPVYADIEADTYNLSAATVEPLITRRTKVILAQNTFGLSADLDPIIELARHHGLHVIEDCAHGLGGSYKGRPNGTVADAAFFSSQWSKPVSIGLGGMAYTRNEEIAARLAEIMANMPGPSLLAQLMLYAQWRIRPLADNPRLYYPLVGAYRFLTRKAGLSVGSNSGIELNRPEMPDGYARRMGSLQRRMLHGELARLDAKVRRRQEVAACYDAYLTSRGITTPYRSTYAEHGMLRYTVRVPHRNELLEKAHQHHIPVGDWFIAPLYPVEGDLSIWGYRRGQCPVAEQACAEVINLPTDIPLTSRQLNTLFKG